MIFENVLVVDPIDGEFVGSVENYQRSDLRVKRSIKNVDFEYILMPGFADPHTHGSIGVDALSMDLKELKKWESFLYSQGVTYFCRQLCLRLPVLYSPSAKIVREYLENNNSTSVGGIHYEGPYITSRRKVPRTLP
jgi:N-acetylglucosamine-6-phosphate deacetylase